MPRTPGPWSNDGLYPHEGSTIVNRHTARAVRRVAIVLNPADGNLIAAAPETAAERDRLKATNADLLAVLEGALALMSFQPAPEPFKTAADWQRHLRNQAKAAIAKARGACLEYCTDDNPCPEHEGA